MSNKKIVFQGIKGAFSYLAATKFFGTKNNFIGLNSFKDIFKIVEKSKADFGVVPIENSLAGSIYENYDNFLNYKVKVIGEIYLKIHHCLLGIKTQKVNLRQRLKLIKEVYSHPKALEQCNKFFEKYKWIKKINFPDTASAAKFVADRKDISIVSLSSLVCAKLYNLEVILKNVEDDKNNYTRFLIISKKEITQKNFDKCSLIFSLSHSPGSLYYALEALSKYKVNLTKIESRPIIGKPFEYIFYLDFEFDSQKYSISDVLKKFRRKVLQLRILGFYQRGKFYED